MLWNRGEGAKQRGHGEGHSGMIWVPSKDGVKLKLLKEELAFPRMLVYFPSGKEKETV